MVIKSVIIKLCGEEAVCAGRRAELIRGVVFIRNKATLMKVHCCTFAKRNPNKFQSS